MKVNTLAVRLTLLTFLCVAAACAQNARLFSGKAGGMTGSDVTRFVSDIRPPRGNADAHFLVARYYQRAGRHREAIEEFHRVVLIDPANVQALNGLGVSCDLSGDFETAEEAYGRALALEPSNEAVLNNLAYSYILRQRPEVAAGILATLRHEPGSRAENNFELAGSMLRDFQTSSYAAEPKVNGTSGFETGRALFRNGFFGAAQEAFAAVPASDALFSDASSWKTASAALAYIHGSAAAEESENGMPTQTSDNALPSKKSAAIEIVNGNGVPRMAHRVGEHLRKKGYSIVKLTNAPAFTQKRTVVSYRAGSRADAAAVRSDLPFSAGLKSRKTNDTQAAVKVILGSDVARRKGPRT